MTANIERDVSSEELGLVWQERKCAIALSASIERLSIGETQDTIRSANDKYISNFHSGRKGTDKFPSDDWMTVEKPAVLITIRRKRAVEKKKKGDYAEGIRRGCDSGRPIRRS